MILNLSLVPARSVRQLRAPTPHRDAPGPAAPGPDQPPPADRPDEEPPALNGRGDVSGEHAEGEHAPSPRYRLRERLAYWASAMHTICMIGALTLSILLGGFCMDWDPAMGPAPPTFLRNHPSTVLGAGSVADAIATCVAASTLRIYTRDELICIFPLGVAFNSAGKRRLIWVAKLGTGQHVPLLPRAPVWAVLCPVAFRYSDAAVIGLWHSARFLWSQGCDPMGSLDDLIFTSGSARGAAESAQPMISILSELGWLIHPTTCVGTSEAAETFTAPRILADLAIPDVRGTSRYDRQHPLWLHSPSRLLTGSPSRGATA